MKPILALTALWLCLLIAACSRQEKKSVEGFSPIYADSAGHNKIALQAAQPIQQGGKIYIYDDMLYQVETNKGIHIIDISNKSKPVIAAFISILGCQEVSAKRDTIFTNNYNDLIAIAVINNQLKLLKRLSNHFTYPMAQSLPPERGYFDCPITIPGKVITGWQKKVLTNPQCFY